MNLSEKPMALLYELVGPPAVQQYGEVFAVHAEEEEEKDRAAAAGGGVGSSSSSVVAVACLHEDGGRSAEYERIDAIEVSSSYKGGVMIMLLW